MPKNKPAVVVTNIKKTFKIPLESSSGLKQKLINHLKGVKGYREFTPLNDISFTVDEGDFFGIVGRNGSGKSTLLKTISGIYAPDGGSVGVNGTLVPFIELGVGFSPELTGRENVYLNGALLGFSHKEMDLMYDGIVEFAELADFMEEKLKNYSSGMQVRLAFSIAIRANGDILILDEVLAVGDSNFQKKCIDYFKQLKRDKKTVILVTHDMGSVERFCNKAILIDNGKIVAQGKPSEVTQKYSDINFDKSSADVTKEMKQVKDPKRNRYDVSLKTEIKGSDSGNYIINADKDEYVDFLFEIDNPHETEDLKLGLIVSNHEGVPIFATNTYVNHIDIPGIDTKAKIKLRIKNIFANGEYTVSTGLNSVEGTVIYYTNDTSGVFIVGGRKHEYAVVNAEYSIVKK